MDRRRPDRSVSAARSGQYPRFSLFRYLGGWPAFAGLASAALVGGWIGASPSMWPGAAADQLTGAGADYDLSEMLPSLTAFIEEG